MLVVLDNCEHLLDASAAVVNELLSASARLTFLITSREQLGVAGEVSWRVPSMSLADEALELFADRARRARPDFRLTADNSARVAEICTRLDGLPLAIELAATRVRAMSLTEIIDSLHDRFRLLTGGSRSALRRQQTLRASVDWSHALLTETERTLFRRLAVFVGGFDIEAIHHVSGDAERYQVLDQLTLLVDKSLVLAEDGSHGTRYRLPETVRQYALERLGESGEGDEMRSRHRDHFASMAALLDAPERDAYERRIQQADVEIDNLRTAFGWNLECGDIESALRLASSLQPLWGAIGRVREGRAWFSTVLSDDEPDVDVRPEVLARALADKSFLDTWEGAASGFVDASRALAIAREVGDPPLLLRALTVFSSAIGYSDNPEAVRPYFAEAADLARHLGDNWHLCEILARQAYAAIVAGDPTAIRAAAEEGRDIADAIGDRFDSRECRLGLAWAQLMQGDAAGAITLFRDVLAESDAAGAPFLKPASSQGLGNALAYSGQIAEALSVSHAAIDAAAELGESFQGIGYSALATAAMAAGDVSTARDACETAWQHMSNQSHLAAAQRVTNAGIVCAAGDFTTARRWLTETMDSTAGWNRARAHLVMARIALADDDLDAALSNAHECLRHVAEFGAFLTLPDVFEFLAVLAIASESYADAARLGGAAEDFRRTMGLVRFTVHDGEYEASVAALRDAMPPEDFDAAWAEGSALSTEEAIAYAQRGRGDRKRPATGWASLTPAELDVVGLVAEGLTNKDVAGRLFISPRTVQSHLAHVFAKLGVTTRTQLAQEAARHA
jgi:predicted ATPase/DNA-binding CsgD family transcriptional regulator